MSDELMVADALSKLEAFGLPHIECMHSLQAMETFPGRRERHMRYPPAVIALATLRERLGDADGARRVIEVCLQRSPEQSAWGTRLRDVLERL
jgi:hypothetical protein